MADVFLSYKREDASRVRKLVDALRAAGLDAWWDEDIPGGAQWEATIERALADAKAVIVCWSPASISSENVRSEARIAREDGRLVQVFLKPCSPPLFFGERQGFDLSKWRGEPGDPRIARIVECVRQVAAGKRAAGGEQPKVRTRLDQRLAAVVAALLLLVVGGVAWWTLRPAADSGPMTLAVLPFRALNPADANLVDAIWDDTRGAISRNPNLRVIGRQAVEALAAKQLQPADYRRKLRADYLLDGSVEHVGDQVQMKLSLVRTEDAAEIWSDQIGGKLDDVFAFQQRVANEVEGRIRGRVAPGGGVSAKNIATSAEVYALFAEARANTRKRNGQGWQAAIALLRKAVAADPNYAPAWAELSVATDAHGNGTAEQIERESSGYARRALELAPNLAHAHAALAFANGLRRETEPELRRAVALDPNDAEAWMWLGNCLDDQNRVRDALQAHGRAVEVEPLWYTAMYNKMDDLAHFGDQRGVLAEVHRAESTGDAYLALRARQHAAFHTAQVAAELRYELEIRRRFPDQARKFDLAELLIQLGFIGEARELVDLPESDFAPYRGIPESPEELRKRFADPKDFWSDLDNAIVYGRLLPRQKRLAEYAQLFNAAFKSADEYHETTSWAGWQRFADMTPNVAANLRAAGDAALAQQLIDKDESILAPLIRNGPADRDMSWQLAQLRAVEGRDDEALAYARRAVAQHWLPNGMEFASDIADEPSFGTLLRRRDFQAIRRQIIAHIDEERRQVTPAMLAAAGLALKKAA